MKSILFILITGITSFPHFFYAQDDRYLLRSPDGKILIQVNTANQLTWSVLREKDDILLPSAIGLEFQGKPMLGEHPQVMNAASRQVNQVLNAPFYKKKSVPDQYNELRLDFKGDFHAEFRAYDDGVAYRLISDLQGDQLINNERCEFNFADDYTVLIPTASDLRGHERYSCSFEEFYTETPISGFNKDTLGYLPFLVKLKGEHKAVIVESDVQNYPCMFIQAGQSGTHSLKAKFAEYPLKEELGGHKLFNLMVTQRSDYIAKYTGGRSFPWRALVISTQDKDLLNNDMVYKLSATNKIKDLSWIKPGKVAWDWWNDWNITKVNFKTGINNETYQYYIDFASKNKLEYIVLDEGWSSVHDLNDLKANLDLQKLIQYGKSKNVGLILWSTWYALQRDPEMLCKKYAEMGIKGFKVDFLDRNDQKVIASMYDIASTAATYHLLLDWHGVFCPQGILRPWPNVINFEGVRGMEYMKWSADDRVPQHEVTLPFIRMIAGPMDYTPGAMRNTIRHSASPNNSMPMSMGTRCHQLAIYGTYEAPLAMMADNPTAYMAEPECTRFIASIPTVFDSTIALDGRLGAYTLIARRNGNHWYIAAMNNWSAKNVSLDLSFLPKGNYQAEIFSDGINANKNANDYTREIKTWTKNSTYTIKMADGGGWAAILKRI